MRRSVLLFWERTQKAVPEGTDAQADVVVTFCRSLLEAGVQFTIAWNDATEQRCVSQQIRSMDELIGLLPRLLSAQENEGLSGAELFLRSSGEAVLSHHSLYHGPCAGAGISAGAVWTPDGAQLRSKRRWSHLL